MDAIDQYIRGHRGVDGSLLGYVTRKSTKLFPPVAADDPTVGDVDSIYMSHDDEVVARHRIIDLPTAQEGWTVCGTFPEQSQEGMGPPLLLTSGH